MSALAAIRPDSVNFPLFLHVLGAMLLVGMLLVVASAVIVAWRRADPVQSLALTRVGLWTLVVGVLPAYVLMRIGAGWTESREHLGDAELDWIGIGYLTSDAGALLILICLVLSGVGLRRLRAGKGIVFGRIVGVVATLLLLAYVVAVWAMTTKPD